MSNKIEIETDIYGPQTVAEMAKEVERISEKADAPDLLVASMAAYRSGTMILAGVAQQLERSRAMYEEMLLVIKAQESLSRKMIRFVEHYFPEVRES